MDNPLKTRPLAKLCTNGLKRGFWRGALQVGQGKGRIMRRKTQVDLRKKEGKAKFALFHETPPAGDEERISWAVGRIVNEGGIGKGSRKETRLWIGCIGKEVAQ
jgi:hypothetical protein